MYVCTYACMQLYVYAVSACTCMFDSMYGCMCVCMHAILHDILSIQNMTNVTNVASGLCIQQFIMICLCSKIHSATSI